ncbi:hypothetical protein JW898_05750 [Candidatus Woesearchaeota archaeon]|nr:hypothetical protein [Candidatus Woesearchaeota archaeon]
MEKRVFILIISVLMVLLIASAAMAAEARAAEEHKYYIAGAYTNQEATALLNILNPGDTPADVQVRIFYEKNDSGGFRLTVPAHSTSSTDLSERMTSNFGLEMTSERPLAADSVQYDTTYSGGFATLAALKPDYVWHFAEGYSSGMVKTYLYILNPGTREANIGVTLYYDTGEKKTFNLNVPAQKHLRVDLKERTMPEKRFGMKVTSTVPVVASAGNFNKKFSGGSGGTGTVLLAKRWIFPDGYTSTEATEFINVLNPSFGVAHITVTLHYDDGTARSFDETVPAQAKKMILLNNYAQEMKWFSTTVDSDVNIAVENTHYDSSYSAGHGGIGATSGATEQHFVNSIADSKSKSHLAVYNPSDKEAMLDITFYYADGTVKQLQERAPALMRSTIDLNKRVIEGVQFGMQLRSTEPVVARQVTYNQKQSSGYSQFGMVIPVDEKEAAEEGLIEDKAPAPETRSEGYALQKEEVVATSRFKERIAAGMSSAAKYTYDKEGLTVVAWALRYSDPKAVSKALSAALGGEMFTLLEVRPDYVSGLPAHSFVAEKSEGYMWTSGDYLYIIVAADAADAYGLAESFVSGNVPAARKKTGLGTIIIVLAALIVLIFFVRWVFRRSPADAEERAAWEDVIPSAKPKTKKPVKKKESAKKEETAKSVKKDAPAKKEKPARKEEKDRQEESHKKDDHKRRAEDHKPEKKHEDRSAKEERRPEHKKEERGQEEKKEEHKKEEHKKEDTAKKTDKVKEISIREIPREKMTAQDLLDQMEEIPEYEDVFRHVNRDQEEIKQK